MEVTVDLSGLDEFVEEVEEYANELMKEAAHNADAVSYTHLTLPTNREV